MKMKALIICKLKNRYNMTSRRSVPKTMLSAMVRFFVIITSFSIAMSQNNQTNSRLAGTIERLGDSERKVQLMQKESRDESNSEDLNAIVDQLDAPEGLKRFKEGEKSNEFMTTPSMFNGGRDGREELDSGNPGGYYASTENNGIGYGEFDSSGYSSPATQDVWDFVETADVSGSRESRVRRNVDGVVNEKLEAGFKEVENVNWQDPSCRARCGETRLSPCSCDKACYVFKTCCVDVAVECPSLEDEARIVMGADLVDGRDLVRCDDATQNFIVEKCLWPQIPVPIDSSSDEDFMEIIHNMAIVHDNVTGLVFRNKSVYNCFRNDSESLQPWAVAFAIKESMRSAMNSPVSMLSAIDPKQAKFYPQSQAVKSRRCRKVIDTCKRTLAHLDPDNLCGKFISYYREPNFKPNFGELVAVYGNRHCFYCNLNSTDGKHGIAENAFGRGDGVAMSVLMDYHRGDSGLEISLTIDAFRSTRAWTCNVPDSSITTDQQWFSGSLPQCNALDCGNPALNKIVNGKCMKEGANILLLRHPPKEHFKKRQLLSLSNFVSCYLQKGKWTFLIQHGGLNKIQYVEVFAQASQQGTRHFISLAQGYDIQNREDYFYMNIEYLYENPGVNANLMMKSYIRAVADAVRYWYLSNDYVVEDEQNVLFYKNEDEMHSSKKTQAEQPNDGINKNEDSDNDLKENGKPGSVEYPQGTLLGLFGATFHPGQFFSLNEHPTPIEKYSSEANFEGLAQCFDGAFNKAVKTGGEKGVAASTSSHFDTLATWVIVFVLFLYG